MALSMFAEAREMKTESLVWDTQPSVDEYSEAEYLPAPQLAGFMAPACIYHPCQR